MSDQIGVQKNVECRRCGTQWYSPKFEKNEELPEYCTECYQPSVQKIIPPPSKFEKFQERTKNQIYSIPDRIHQKRKNIRDFRETNRMLISLANTAIIITLITSLAIYFIFLR